MTSGGALNTRQTYYPYGAKRMFDGSALPTDYTFTGQKSDDSTGLMFYGARYYDTTLGRFTQADTIIPNVLDPQSWNRYAYVNNNPVRYIDPTGHMLDEPDDTGGDNNGGGEYVDDRPYCEKFPYAAGCYDPGTLPATDNGNPNQDDAGSCWPHCRDGEDVSDGGYDPANNVVQEAKAPKGGGGGRAFASPPQQGGGCGNPYDPFPIDQCRRFQDKHDNTVVAAVAVGIGAAITIGLATTPLDVPGIILGGAIAAAATYSIANVYLIVTDEEYKEWYAYEIAYPTLDKLFGTEPPMFDPVITSP